MESYFMDLKYDGLYHSWPFFTTKLVIDQTTIPLAEASITHMVALEVYYILSSSFIISIFLITFIYLYNFRNMSDKLRKTSNIKVTNSCHLHRCPLCVNFLILHK